MVATDVPSFFLRVGGWEGCADAERSGALCLGVGERPVPACHLVGGRGRVSASFRAGGGRRVPGEGRGEQRKRCRGDRRPGHLDNVVMTTRSRGALPSADDAAAGRANRTFCRDEKPVRAVRGTKTSTIRRGGSFEESPSRLRGGNS
ncbi:hypothetical protein GCM10010243_13260 [Streptomyces matensis]|nr:hypothetical protein GCM10010267_66180 [Streptomyces griseorubens]GGT37669.1 hypothetical protein GCM10010243_13260 [Streptomyces matensis]